MFVENNGEKKKKNIRNQVLIPLFVAMIFLIIIEEVGLLYFSWQRSSEEKVGRVARLSGYIADTIESYDSIDWLTDYWKEHEPDLTSVWQEAAIVGPVKAEDREDMEDSEESEDREALEDSEKAEDREEELEELLGIVDK